MTKYSIAAAHRITGKSRTTITKHIKKGRLSVEIDDDGKKVVDATELHRVYGDDCNFEREEGAKTTPNSSAIKTKEKTEQGVQHDVHSLREQLKKETSERELERNHYRQQVDHLQDALKLAQEGQNKAMLLLDGGSLGGGQWEKAVEDLETQIANQKSDFESRVGKLKSEARTEVIKELKSKSWLQALFSLLFAKTDSSAAHAGQ